MATITLTATQYKLLGAVVDVQSAKAEWNAVAETAGLDAGKKARDNFPAIKKKMAVALTDEKTVTVELTDAQKSLLNAVIGANVDFKASAEKAGLDTAKKARDNFTAIKKKLNATGEPAEKKKGGKKRKADEAVADGEADTETPAPAKKAKATPKKEAVKKPAATKKPAAKGKKGKKADTPVEDEPEPASEEAAADEMLGDHNDGVEGEEERLPGPSIFGNGGS